MSKISFLGAAGTVTGSRHLIEHEGKRILLDCGLFQGRKKWRKRNWDEFPVDPSSVDAVVLSHAHIDHAGWLPRLVASGFTGPIYTTPATRDLSAIMLPDSGRIQEEDARYANKKKFSKHKPALPLYTEKDATRTIPLMKATPYNKPRAIGDGIELTFRRAGHILGSGIVQVDLGADKRVVFTGDLGRYDAPIIPDPEPVERATHLLLECTYGNRIHEQHHPQSDLANEVKKTIAAKGILIIPSFAIGRTQNVLYLLDKLQRNGEIGTLPIFVDSPMACNATPLYLMHRDDHDEEMAELILGGEEPLYPEGVKFTRSVQASRDINDVKGPAIIVSASGMATGGRVLHHLKRRLPHENTTVLFVGYQAYGTRGRRLLEGEESVRIHGQNIPVRARIGQIYGFSGHADQVETDRWLSDFENPPAMTYCVHGEPDSLDATRERLESRGWPATVPEYQQTLQL
jgi:metallo-beta-lactamase family protein